MRIPRWLSFRFCVGFCANNFITVHLANLDALFASSRYMPLFTAFARPLFLASGCGPPAKKLRRFLKVFACFLFCCDFIILIFFHLKLCKFCKFLKVQNKICFMRVFLYFTISAVSRNSICKSFELFCFLKFFSIFSQKISSKTGSEALICFSSRNLGRSFFPFVTL